MLHVITPSNENYIGFSSLAKLTKYMFAFYIGVGHNCSIRSGYISHLHFLCIEITVYKASFKKKDILSNDKI